MSLCEIMCNTTSVCVNACGVFILFNFRYNTMILDAVAATLQKKSHKWALYLFIKLCTIDQLLSLLQYLYL